MQNTLFKISPKYKGGFRAKFAFVLALFQFMQLNGISQAAPQALATTVNDHFAREVSNNSTWFAQHPPQKPEAFLCMLRTDSTGKIWDIQLLADEKFTDSAYAIFQRLLPADFTQWRNVQYKNTTFLIPIYVLVGKMSISEITKLTGLDAVNRSKKTNLFWLEELVLGWVKRSH